MLGSTVGPYEVKRELGTGGMGTVYLAEGEGQTVALKIVHPHLIATPGFFKRFMREAELGRKIKHQNVVRTLDVDATIVDGQHINYMVMEYVEGKSLRELLNELHTIPETLLREIALQTAAGLAAIHAGDIVHRDLKPENVLITDDEEIRIMDLGVAKLQEASIAITKEGQFAGSLLYAAPEQFKKGDVGPAADQYSLGVLLYELATGQNPFRSDDAATVIQSHLNETPSRAHERNQDLSPFLSEVIATLLAKPIVQRFASADELHTVLGEAERSEWWAEHEPVETAHLPKIRVNRETELHGRADSLALLRELYELASEGQGNTVWLEGEAGIGKTRLVDAFLRDVENAHVLYGSYPPSGGMGGFSDAILDKFGTGRLAEAVTPYLTETPTLVPAFAALVKHEAAPTGSDPVQGDALHAVAVQLMRALAAEKPTVWVIDDLHFAPEESKNLVLALARAVEGHKVLVIATSRPGVELADFSRLSNFRRVEIGRLSPREVVHLLQDAFRSELLAEKLGGKIALKSDGVPFFVFEMIRGLKEGQFITQQADGTYVQTQVVDEIQVPSAVKDLIEQRMRDLTPDQRALLDVGAVCGMSFDPALVAAVLEEKRVRVLRELAEVERRHGLVRGEAGATHFDQNQIQEVLYASLPPDLRREYHSLLAEAHDGDDAYFLALHHLKGSRPKQGLEHVDPALDQLLAAYRNEAAFELMDLALKHIEGRERVKLLDRKAALLAGVGNYNAHVAVAEEAHELAKELEEDELLLRALVTVSAALWRVGRVDDAKALADQTLELARKLGDRRQEAHAEVRLGNLVDDFDEQMAHNDRALAIFVELGDRRGEMSATTNKGLAVANHGRPAEALEWLQRALEIARELGDRRVEGGNHVNLGLACSGMGRLDEAEDYHRRGREILREIGARDWEAEANLLLGRVFEKKGLLADSLAVTQRGLELKVEAGDRTGEVRATRCLADLYLTFGQLDEASRLADLRAIVARDLGGPWPLWSDRLLAACAEARGDLHEAERLYRKIAAADDDERDPVLLAIARLRPADAAEILSEAGAPESPYAKVLTPALLGDADATRAAIEQHGKAVGVETCMEAYYRIGDFEKARELLAHLREHAPEEDRDSMIENVPLHKEIMDAR